MEQLIFVKLSRDLFVNVSFTCKYLINNKSLLSIYFPTVFWCIQTKVQNRKLKNKFKFHENIAIFLHVTLYILVI